MDVVAVAAASILGKKKSVRQKRKPKPRKVSQTLSNCSLALKIMFVNANNLTKT